MSLPKNWPAPATAQNPASPVQDPWQYCFDAGDYVPVATCECPARAAGDGCHETWCARWKQYRDMPDRVTPDVLGPARRGR
jgi:hypothetical protein